MIKNISRNDARKKRHFRIRKNIVERTTLPRLNVFKSNKYIYAQIIDDSKCITLVSASSNDKEMKLENGSNVEAAKKVGALIAKRALEQSIADVVFDRGGYLFHGKVKALADAAREAGLKF